MDLECQICCDFYTTSGLHRPRCLPCGHTLCSSCIKRMLVNGVMLCPVCQQCCMFQSFDKVTVNRELEKVIDMLKSASFAKTKDVPTPKVPKLHDGICDEHGIYKVHHCLTHSASICSECVVAYHLEENCHRIPLEKVLTDRKTEICKKIDSHMSVLKGTGRQVELYNNLLRKIEHQTNSRVNQTQLSIQQLQSKLRILKQNMSNCQKSNSKYTQLFIEFQTQLENAEHSLSRVQKRITFQGLNTETHQMELTEHKAKEWTKKVKNILQQTITYASYTHEEQQRWGHIMIKDGYLFLQKFGINMPPPGSVALDLMEVQNLMPSSRHVYMTLATKDNTLGVIVIRLNEEAPKRAQQLIDVFLGHTGKMYHGHNEITVDNKGFYNEFLDFPFYTDHSKSNINENEEDIPILEKTGNVAHKQGLLIYYGIDSAMFRILTRRGKEESTVAGPAIGEVVLGLPLLKKIIRDNLVRTIFSLETISDVIISETGLVVDSVYQQI